jgi:hypothetical protein
MFNLVIGFLNDFLIIAGGMITAGMLAQDQIAIPRAAVVLLACLTGLVQAARRLQSKLDPSPVKPEAVVVRSEAQLLEQIHQNETAASALVDAFTRAVATATPPPPVTPKRVEVPAEPVKVVKDSS